MNGEGATGSKNRRICLDFANTVDWRTSDHPEDKFEGYADFVAWSRNKGILTEEEARGLLDRALRNPESCRVVFERAMALREAIFRIVSSTVHGRSPDREDLSLFNRELAEAMSHASLVANENGFGWSLAGGGDALDRILWPIVHDTADLLTSSALATVGECAGEGCAWFFIDRSRNRSRQWCSMDSCGNRAKARRFYRKQRSSESESSAPASEPPIRP